MIAVLCAEVAGLHPTDTELGRLSVVGGASMRADGNSVDLDTEAAEQAANGLHYEAIVSVMRARLGIIQSAMGTGQ